MRFGKQVYTNTSEKAALPPFPTFSKDFLAAPRALSSFKYDARGFSETSGPNYQAPIVTSDSTVNGTDNGI